MALKFHARAEKDLFFSAIPNLSLTVSKSSSISSFTSFSASKIKKHEDFFPKKHCHKIKSLKESLWKSKALSLQRKDQEGKPPDITLLYNAGPQKASAETVLNEQWNSKADFQN